MVGERSREIAVPPDQGSSWSLREPFPGSCHRARRARGAELAAHPGEMVAQARVNKRQPAVLRLVVEPPWIGCPPVRIVPPRFRDSGANRRCRRLGPAQRQPRIVVMTLPPSPCQGVDGLAGDILADLDQLRHPLDRIAGSSSASSANRPIGASRWAREASRLATLRPRILSSSRTTRVASPQIAGTPRRAARAVRPIPQPEPGSGARPRANPASRQGCLGDRRQTRRRPGLADLAARRRPSWRCPGRPHRCDRRRGGVVEPFHDEADRRIRAAGCGPRAAAGRGPCGRRPRSRPRRRSPHPARRGGASRRRSPGPGSPTSRRKRP